MKRKIYAVVIFAIVFVISSLFLSSSTSPTYQTEKKGEKSRAKLIPYDKKTPNQNTPDTGIEPRFQETVLVTRVIDGDTIEIEGSQKVRYIGIGTPETSDPRTGVQCYGKEATKRNQKLVGGKRVYLEKDISETDKYGRLLRYIFVGDQLINEVLVKEGFAFSSPYPPDVKYQERFNQAEKYARENSKGLWGYCGFIAGAETKVVLPDSECSIKGNISSSGENIYHVPGQKYYNQTVVSESKGEKWFCSEEEAKRAGWRRSKL